MENFIPLQISMVIGGDLIIFILFTINKYMGDTENEVTTKYNSDNSNIGCCGFVAFIFLVSVLNSLADKLDIIIKLLSK